MKTILALVAAAVLALWKFGAQPCPCEDEFRRWEGQ